ncbi:hypothetical protein G9C85_17455 [Halorubellus sp. JP-L1]|uniref:hypothetical protein n=1 Tax=Halorubellus sp. JP-L1 TaxID=2715753 RepID=UPI0014076579|nr:hypothetical protein [Halorubellus sp. JP-L1]NHN43407.1 hypothetical protein [Halorubellus sp. JP-L1]
MAVLQSLRAWSNPEWPTTPTYAAVARFGVRRVALVTVLGVGGQFAILLPAGFYAMAAFFAGAHFALATGYFGGAAVMFRDYGRAALAAAATATILLGTGAAMHALRHGDDQSLLVALVAFTAIGSLATGVAGYTAAERATWAAED